MEVACGDFLETVHTHTDMPSTHSYSPGQGEGKILLRGDLRDWEEGCISPGTVPKGLARNHLANKQQHP